MRIVSIDTESPYSDEVSVKPLGYWKYARHPWVDEYIISVCDGKEAWAGEARDFNFDSLAGATLLMHNAAHDEEILLAGVERGFFQIPGLKQFGNTHVHCTANMSSYLWNMRSLADACRVGLGVSVSKDVRNRAKGKKWADIKREGWWDSFIQYAREDAQLPWFLWDKHNSKWPEFERRLSRLTIDQGRRGVRIDVEALDLGIALLHRVIHTAQQNLPWVTRGKAPASPIGIAEECRTVGIPPPPVKAHDPEAAEKWEVEHAPRYKFVLALRNLRKAKKTLATLETIKLRIRPDETVAFSLKYAGAHTLRWAGDAGWNLQNMNREPLFIDPEFSFVFDRQRIKELVTEFEQQDATAGALPSGTSFFDMRGLIIARPGMKLAPVDLAQIEPRVLNHLAGNTELLARVAAGESIYEAHARTTMAWMGGVLKDEDKKLYALAKARCIQRGTPVLTSRGYLAIEQVDLNDLVWDGQEYVRHGGVICSGFETTVDVLGERYTHDHAIFEGLEEKSVAGLVSARPESAQRYRETASDGWAEIWQLARLVGRACAERLRGVVRSLSLRSLRSGGFSFARELEERNVHPVQEVRP